MTKLKQPMSRVTASPVEVKRLGAPKLKPLGEKAKLLAKMLAAGLAKSGLTVHRLARTAAVSTNTINSVLKENPRDTLRWDAAVRLAVALEQSVEDWVDALSISPGSKLYKLARELETKLRFNKSGVSPPHESAPIIYLRQLQEKVKTSETLMACCYLSVPRATTSAEIRKPIVECLKRHLWIALVCPYPAPGSNGFTSEKIALSQYSVTVLQAVRLLAARLREEVPPKHRHKIVVLCPRLDTDHPSLPQIVPPLQLIQYRPALLCFAPPSTGQSSDRQFELGIWLQTALGASDQWIKIDLTQVKNATEKAKETYENTIESWKAYFADVLRSWCPEKNGWDYNVLSNSLDWQLDDSL